MRKRDLHKASYLLHRLGFIYELPTHSFILHHDAVIKGRLHRFKHVLPIDVLLNVDNWPFTLQLYRLECEERWNKYVRTKFSYRKEHGYVRDKF